MTKISPFEFAKAVGESQEDRVLSGELDLAQFDQFMVMTALSHRRDAVEGCNLVNGLRLSNAGAWRVLRAAIPKRRTQRDEYWARAAKVDGLAKIKDYFGVGNQRALEILWTIGDEGVKKIDEMAGGPATKTRNSK